MQLAMSPAMQEPFLETSLERVFGFCLSLSEIGFRYRQPQTSGLLRGARKCSDKCGHRPISGGMWDNSHLKDQVGFQIQISLRPHGEANANEA